MALLSQRPRLLAGHPERLLVHRGSGSGLGRICPPGGPAQHPHEGTFAVPPPLCQPSGPRDPGNAAASLAFSLSSQPQTGGAPSSSSGLEFQLLGGGCSIPLRWGPMWSLQEPVSHPTPLHPSCLHRWETSSLPKLQGLTSKCRVTSTFSGKSFSSRHDKILAGSWPVLGRMSGDVFFLGEIFEGPILPLEPVQCCVP